MILVNSVDHLSENNDLILPHSYKTIFSNSNTELQFNSSPVAFHVPELARKRRGRGRMSHPRRASSCLPLIQTLLSYSCLQFQVPLHLVVVVSKFCPRITFPELQLGHGLPQREPGRRALSRLRNSRMEFWRRSKRPKIHCPLRRSRPPPSTRRRRLLFFGPRLQKKKSRLS